MEPNIKVLEKAIAHNFIETGQGVNTICKTKGQRKVFLALIINLCSMVGEMTSDRETALDKCFPDWRELCQRVKV